jgi:transcription initiation factor TFIID subunit 6
VSLTASLPLRAETEIYPAHWLAVEGVQPTIPQNPTSNDSRNLELLPKGPNANSALAAMSGADNTATKPQVKHILSKELQLYFEKVCQFVLDETQEESRTAGLASLKDDPGLHQLVPYFVQFIAEKVTHNLKDLFVLTQMMNVTEALTSNDKLNLAPYVRFSRYNLLTRLCLPIKLVVLTCISVTGSFPYSIRSHVPHRPPPRFRH